MMLSGAAGAPDGMDFLDNLRFGQWALSGAQAHLVDDREDVLPGALAGHAALEHMCLELVPVVHVELLPDFLRKGNGQLTVTDARFRHRSLQHVRITAGVGYGQKAS